MSDPLEPQVNDASFDDADFELYDAIQEDAAVRQLRSEVAIHMLQDGYLDLIG